MAMPIAAHAVANFIPPLSVGPHLTARDATPFPTPRGCATSYAGTPAKPNGMQQQVSLRAQPTMHLGLQPGMQLNIQHSTQPMQPSMKPGMKPGMQLGAAWGVHTPVAPGAPPPGAPRLAQPLAHLSHQDGQAKPLLVAGRPATLTPSQVSRLSTGPAAEGDRSRQTTEASLFLAALPGGPNGGGATPMLAQPGGIAAKSEGIIIMDISLDSSLKHPSGMDNSVPDMTTSTASTKEVQDGGHEINRRVSLVERSATDRFSTTRRRSSDFLSEQEGFEHKDKEPGRERREIFEHLRGEALGRRTRSSSPVRRRLSAHASAATTASASRAAAVCSAVTTGSSIAAAWAGTLRGVSPNFQTSEWALGDTIPFMAQMHSKSPGLDTGLNKDTSSDIFKKLIARARRPSLSPRPRTTLVPECLPLTVPPVGSAKCSWPASSEVFVLSPRAGTAGTDVVGRLGNRTARAHNQSDWIFSISMSSAADTNLAPREASPAPWALEASPGPHAASEGASREQRASGSEGISGAVQRRRFPSPRTGSLANGLQHQSTEECLRSVTGVRKAGEGYHSGAKAHDLITATAADLVHTASKATHCGTRQAPAAGGAAGISSIQACSPRASPRKLASPSALFFRDPPPFGTSD